MGSCLAFVYVSVFEGFGIPLLDAMQAEVPILTSNVTSLPEVAGNAALLVDPFSVNSISEGLTRLHKEEKLRKKLVSEGKDQVRQYTWERSAAVIWDVLEALARG